jgi:hypothetical protein
MTRYPQAGHRLTHAVNDFLSAGAIVAKMPLRDLTLAISKSEDQRVVGPGAYPVINMSLKHPDGSVQALSSAATGLFAIMIAFIGYTCYGSTYGNTPWHPTDIFFLIPAGLGCIFLALVPWLATKQRMPEDIGKSIEGGRRCFAIGALLSLAAILIYLTFLSDVPNPTTKTTLHQWVQWG